MQELIYFSVVSVGAILFLTRFGLNNLSFLVFLIFWEGLFEYLGLFVTGLWPAYKIFIFIFSIFYAIKGLPLKAFNEERKLNLLYFLFAISFFVTHLLFVDQLVTLLSQFFYKYSSILIIFFIIKGVFISKTKVVYLKRMLLNIIFIQIFFSFIKIIIFGFSFEPHVGSVEYGSGGKAVVIPIIMLFFFYIIGLRRVSLIDKVVYLSPLILAFASGKRTPVFLFPVYLLFMVGLYEGKRQLIKQFKYLPLILLLFYIGIRSNKSLNPEQSNWGSFDLEYAIDYALEYNFGTKEFAEINNREYSAGRGGSFFLLFEPEKLALDNYQKILFGNGVLDDALSKEDRFVGGKTFKIDHIGLLGTAAIELYSLGYVGAILIMVICFVILLKTNNIYLRGILVSFYLFEFLFYANQMLFTYSSSILVLFSIFYHNYFFKNNNNTKCDEK